MFRIIALQFLILVLNFNNLTGQVDGKTQVYKIKASDCSTSSGSITSTGVLVSFKGRNAILTTLHGVCGCKNIRAVSEVGRDYSSLSIKAINLEADLAIIFTAGISGKPVEIGTIDQNSIKGKEVALIGYAKNISSIMRRDAKVDRLHPIAKLSNVLTPAARKKLAERKSPQISTPVIRLTGGNGSLPGLSGAPIIFQGKVIGIVDGGLDQGGTDLGWGIPIPVRLDDLKLLTNLNSSERALFANLKQVPFLFGEFTRSEEKIMVLTNASVPDPRPNWGKRGELAKRLSPREYDSELTFHFASSPASDCYTGSNGKCYNGRLSYILTDVTKKNGAPSETKEVFGTSFSPGSEYRATVLLKRGHTYELTGKIEVSMRTVGMGFSVIRENTSDHYDSDELKNNRFKIIGED